jgi:flagellar biosynthetic protein FliO
MESAGPLVGGAGSLGGSLGGSLAISLVSLGVVCALAYVCLRFLSRKGIGRASGPVKIVARCPLEPRRALYLVEIAGRRFLIGVGDGPMSMLAEIDPAPAAGALAAPVSASPRAGSRFAEVLDRALGRGSDSGAP